MSVAALIDPLAPILGAQWTGASVTVRRVRPGVLGDRLIAARRDGGRLIVDHAIGAGELSDDLATIILAELAGTGVPAGRAEFEEIFTGIVRSTVAGPLDSWSRFYRNSMARLENGTAGFAPVHARAEGLVRGGSMIDLGSCFGFFPLRMAARGISALATDLSAPTMALLSRAGARLGRPVSTLVCDAAAVPMPDRSADTVTVLHLLEHLPAAAAEAVLGEALRLARRRVVIAVPFEAEPTACYGHVDRYDSARLHRIAHRLRCRHPGLTATVAEHHGGWLVLDSAA